MFNLFNERKTKLANGKEVREGDKIFFIDSDRKRHEGVIERRKFDCKHSDTGEVLKRGTLFFWNNTFKPSDYYSADVGSSTLSRAKAQIAFVEGKKISHKYFLDGEFVKLNADKKMEDENGNILDKMDFWLARGTKQFDDGWFVVE